MLIYNGTKSGFMQDIRNDLVVGKLFNILKEKMHRTTQEAEIRSWKNSLTKMYIALDDKAIPDDVGVAIEYNIPMTAKRIDFLISGYDNKGVGNVIIVELKQWEKAEAVIGEENIVNTFVAGANRNVPHPSYQAWSYSAFIKDYNEYVQDEKIILKPCAYLHNYQRVENDPIDNKIYAEVLNEAPVFTQGQCKDLQDYIKKYICKGDDKDNIVRIDNGRIKPSKQLQDTVESLIDGNDEFIMIDEQKVVFEKIREVSKRCQKDGKKRCVIVKGGPGTGKSVVTMNLLAKLTKDDQLVQYVTKNSTPRQIYCQKLKNKYKGASINNMFKGSGSYIDAESGLIDTLLCDEAHRLNEKSGMFANLGENQIKEIIHAAYCSVFFIDEHQRVTLKDIGSVKEIEKWAEYEGAEIFYEELLSQFRCNGSNGYLSFIDNTLEIASTANYDLNGIDYDFKVCDTPEELDKLIKKKNKINNKSRILAGYCWEWPKETRRDTNYKDIKIGNYGISWNLDGDIFALNPDSVNEAGCIHTTQGLEFDYVGIIIGDDMRYENGHIVTDYKKRAKTDQSLKGINTISKKNSKEAEKIADEIIKNTYRTLLTRGMKGCYVYCTNPGLKNHFKECMNDSI